jgi:hypothetical protein
LESILDKLLFVNLNYTLPSLVHLNQQCCKAVGVLPENPFTDESFLYYAKSLNRNRFSTGGANRWNLASGLPKEPLRETTLPLPGLIRHRRDKRGFPIPWHTWREVERMIEKEYGEFKLIDLPPFTGVNRFSWGVAQTNLFMKRSK